MADMALLEEADKRGLLPPEKKALLDEARRRGLGGVASGLSSMAKNVTIPQGDMLDQMMAQRQWPEMSGIGGRAQDRGFVGRSLDALSSAPGDIAGYAGKVASAVSPMSDRGLTERVADTAAFVTSAPIRMATRGQYGLGDVVQGVTGGMTGQGISANEQRFQENNPDLMWTLGAAGEVAPGLTLGLGMGAMTPPVQVPRLPGERMIRRAYANSGENGAYGRVADDIGQGVDEFSNQVAAGASRANVATNRRTLDILGEEMERAGGNVAAARQATIDRISREFGVAPATAAQQIRRLTAVHEDSPLLLGEYPAVVASDAAQRLRQPGNVDLDALRRAEETPTQAKLDYLANNGVAQSAQDTRNAIMRRQEELGPRMRQTMESFAPRHQTGPRTTRPADITDAAQLVDDARRQASAEYDAAYNTPVATPQRYQQFPRYLEYLANRAATSAPEVAQTIRNAVNQIAVRRPDGTFGLQSLRQLQNGRTTLRGQMEALHRAGRDDLARQIRPLYQLTTRIMEEMSPQWAVANRRWADMRFAELAQELGDSFVKRAGPRHREQLAEYRAMAPEAQAIVRIHWLQQIYDAIDNLGDTHSVSKLLATPHARNMVREMFGDEAAATFVRAVRDQKVAERSQAMLGNSRTHTRKMAQEQMDTETGLRAAVDSASVHGARNAILQWVGQLLTERRNRPMSRILTTPMRDTAQVARHLHRMRQQQQRLRDIDRGRVIGLPGRAVAGGIIGAGIGVGEIEEQ